MIERKLIEGGALKRRIADRIKKSYFVRFHMFMILSATVLSGVICSKILILLGVTRMPVRYGITIILRRPESGFGCGYRKRTVCDSKMAMHVLVTAGLVMVNEIGMG
jgi:hypothetical protein